MTSSRCNSAIAIVLAVSSVAFAEGAREAYSRGLSLYSTGHYAEAAAAFLAAYEKRPKPVILFNVGQAYRKSGELDNALVYYRRFLDEASPDERAPLAEETRKYVHEIEAEQAVKRSLTDKDDREEAATLHFDKPAAPPPAAPSAVAPSQPVAASPSAPAPAAAAAAPAVTAEAKPTRQPLVRRWWLWTSLGVVVVGAAVGLGVGLGGRSNDPSTALGTRQPSF